ncbi:MAG: ATP-binding protein [Crenarchaeota archaeon]|nr:ATP-binding protein [Thermoproteota archaeon]
MAGPLGKVIEGSLSRGLKVLVRDENIENYPVGALVVIKGTKHHYLGVITDIGIESAGETVKSFYGSRIGNELKDIAMDAIKDYVNTRFIEIALLGQSSGEMPRSADTIPNFYSDVVEVRQEDIKVLFGEENQKNLWNIGTPKVPGESTVYIPVDIEKLIELSFGIFGKSGTGKTFLGNILAGYMILYDDQKSSVDKESKRLRLLIFDMHSEYSLKLRDNKGNVIADGIASMNLFSNKFLRYTPDLELAKEAGLEELRIDYSDLTVDDLRLIAPIFGVSEGFLEHLGEFASILKRDERCKLGDLWVWGLILDKDSEDKMMKDIEGRKILDEIKKRTNVEDADKLRRMILKVIKDRLGPSACSSFRSQTAKLKQLLNYPYTYITEEEKQTKKSSIDAIVDNLVSENGRSVVISMGKYEKETPLYMIMANLIARRLRERILSMIVRGEELKTKIVIFLEEAHNFLGRETYRMSPFGEIAREMRKKGVTLCVIDQKPSELDDDVISMLWTSFVFTLTDERDIGAALMGTPRASLLRKVVPVLERQEVLIHGEAVNFPVVVKVLNYKKAAEIFKEHKRRKLDLVRQIMEQG